VSKWNRLSTTDDRDMFSGSAIGLNLNSANPSFGQVKSHFLAKKLEKTLNNSKLRQSQISKVRL